MREILKPVFINGACVYDSPSVMEIAAYCAEEKENTLGRDKNVSSIHTKYMWICPANYMMKNRHY